MEVRVKVPASHQGMSGVKPEDKGWNEANPCPARSDVGTEPTPRTAQGGAHPVVSCTLARKESVEGERGRALSVRMGFLGWRVRNYYFPKSPSHPGGKEPPGNAD